MMASTPEALWQISLDGETFTATAAPSRTSRQVRLARSQLLSDLDVTTLSDDLSRVSRLLTLSHAAACAASDPNLAEHITALSRKLIHLFSVTTTSIAQTHLAARAVLSELSQNARQLSSRALPAALHAFDSNDDLARTLSLAAANLSALLSSAAEDATVALEKAQHRRAERAQESEVLHDRITELNVRKAVAWETHGSMLESLSEVGRLYARAERVERRASRRATVFGALAFVEHIDRFLTDHFGMVFLGPVVRFLESVRKDASHAKEERTALLEAKKHQRLLNREALADITECSRRIQEVKSDVDAVMAAIESLHAVAKELKRLSVVVMRVSSFWSQLHANMGRLSVSELVKLIRATADPSLGVSGTGDLPFPAEVAAGDSALDLDVGDTHSYGQDDLEGMAADNVINVSVKQEPWIPCTAVQRKMVTYYARWVALEEVCAECLREILVAKSDADKATYAQAEMCELTPLQAREQVARMAADLRKEMDDINAELDQFRSHGEHGTPASDLQ